ncbi:hypothetical protein [Acinetobacter bereziniae]|uniref:hypothetical protein n=1 Tax=Acinetobacter bereziniae TaxID=106648 RepID=UPI00057462D4|nr:hypothetical protein [Acinetobacter bereziniae]CEI54455.1 hypothetical protein [Acinetobacter bereziniae]
MDIQTTLLVTFFSAFIAFIVQYFFKWREYKNNHEALQRAIISEISALYHLARAREYKKEFDKILNNFKLYPDIKQSLTIEFQDNLTPVYSNNLDKIGLLSIDVVEDVVKFYACIFAIKQDLKAGGVLTNFDSATPDAFKNVYLLFLEILRLGESLSQKSKSDFRKF